MRNLGVEKAFGRLLLRKYENVSLRIKFIYFNFTLVNFASGASVIYFVHSQSQVHTMESYINCLAQNAQ